MCVWMYVYMYVSVCVHVYVSIYVHMHCKRVLDYKCPCVLGNQFACLCSSAERGEGEGEGDRIASFRHKRELFRRSPPWVIFIELTWLSPFPLPPPLLFNWPLPLVFTYKMKTFPIRLIRSGPPFNRCLFPSLSRWNPFFTHLALKWNLF